MEALFPGLHASAPESLPFAPSLAVRTFLLEREGGNVLLYSNSTVEGDAGEMAELGGISRHYLNHSHEAGFGCDAIGRAFGAPLFCHEAERESVAAKCAVAGTFSERSTLDDDFEIVPIPGHTEGATAFLWESGEHRFLFTGDTIILDEGEWVAAVLEGSSDRDAYIESLELMRGLEFDVLVPWAATGGRPPHALTDAADASTRIDAILERVRRGESH